MLTRLLKAKIHHAVVTQTNPDYHGSITIDRELLKFCDLLPYEAVLVAEGRPAIDFPSSIAARRVLHGPSSRPISTMRACACLLTSRNWTSASAGSWCA